MKHTDTTERFIIRSYGKGELAALYLPDISARSALNTFNQWIHKCPGLTDRLETTGLRPNDRRFTPMQVRIIVEALGEP